MAEPTVSDEVIWRWDLLKGVGVELRVWEGLRAGARCTGQR